MHWLGQTLQIYHSFRIYSYVMTPYGVLVLFRVELCGRAIPEAKFLTLRLLESLRVLFRNVMTPKINEIIYLVSLA
jgi:hypothetical protein